MKNSEKIHKSFLLTLTDGEAQTVYKDIIVFSL